MVKLYKRTATGATQVWWQEINGNKYRTVSGQLNGELVYSEWTVAEPKNIARSNYTSSEEQAKKEVAANYKKKLAQGNYKEDIEDIGLDNYFKPMLAHTYGDYEVSFPVYAQPKLDGIRCIANKDGLWSRTGKKFVAVPHIELALKHYFDDNPGLVLDGELYNHELKDDFNTIVSLVRKVKCTSSDLALSRALVQYHIYDVPSKKPFIERKAPIVETGFIKIVPTFKCTNTDKLDENFAWCIENGYEGQMVRTNGPYEQKRSKNLLKRKEFVTEEFPIVDIKEGVGNRTGMAGFITYKHGDKTFSSGIRGTHEFCIKLLKNKDQYSMGTVRFFHYTPDGIPRFPVTVDVHNGRDD